MLALNPVRYYANNVCLAFYERYHASTEKSNEEAAWQRFASAQASSEVSGKINAGYASDRELWGAFKNGDEAAFIAIYRQYFPVLFRYGSQFTWDSSIDWFETEWEVLYQAIRDANILLENLEDEGEFNRLVRAEANFIRGWSYYLLHLYFGPTPLYTSSSDEYNQAKASEDDMQAFIEQELMAAADGLPAEQEEYGRATEGAALGLLCKFYLNTKQWQKSADVAQQIIDLNRYALVSNYADVFSLDNEGNAELLWTLVRTASGAVGNTGGAQYINAHTFPTDYPLLPNQSVYAARTYFFDEFINSFEEGDTRRDMIVTEYVNTSGELIILLGNDQSLSLKYEFDPNANGPGMGNDMPEVRYADVLLSRAEALNELNGPSQESIDLINQVRARAGVSLLSLNSFSTKESLRDHIMKEREWEFYAEAKRRQDQIRAETFIQKAQARGHNAQPFHKLFPIPLSEINANPNLEQNTGY